VKRDGTNTNGAFKSVLNRLRLNKMPDFNITILGGEPTLHPEFKYIVKDLMNNNKCSRLGVVTNLTRSIDYYTDILITDKIFILASYHPEFAKLDVFKNKCRSIADRKSENFKCSINLHYNKIYWEETIELIEFFKNENINFSLNILYDTRTGADVLYNYTDEFYKTFSDYDTYFSGDEHFPIMGGGSPDVKIPYITPTNTAYIDIKNIREDGLHKFQNYNCSPRMFEIDYMGVFRNSCTNEIIKMTANSYVNCIKCPVESGCKCIEMLCYHKTSTI
jgi:MoaA/NifB/PqqE/SkfB family radical SAM enzyme